MRYVVLCGLKGAMMGLIVALLFGVGLALLLPIVVFVGMCFVDPRAAKDVVEEMFVAFLGLCLFVLVIAHKDPD